MFVDLLGLTIGSREFNTISTVFYLEILGFSRQNWSDILIQNPKQVVAQCVKITKNVSEIFKILKLTKMYSKSNFRANFFWFLRWFLSWFPTITSSLVEQNMNLINYSIWKKWSQASNLWLCFREEKKKISGNWLRKPHKYIITKASSHYCTQSCLILQF